MGAKLGNKKVQIVVVCMLAAVVLYNAVHFLGKKPRRRDFTFEDAGFEESGPAITPTWVTGKYEPAASWGTNPFTGRAAQSPAAAATGAAAVQTISAPPPKSATVEITGVMISGENRYVLAGDLLLREGDRLGAGRIKTINRNSVIVEYESGTKTIYID